MDTNQLQGLVQQQAQLLQQTVEQHFIPCLKKKRKNINAHKPAMNAMAEMVHASQTDVSEAAESSVQMKDKELMTTERASTMLPN